MNDDSPRSEKAPPERRARIRDVVREVVAEVAPDETVIIDGFEGTGNARAVRRLERRSGRSEPLGFGVGDLVPIVAPVVWIVLTKFLETLAEEASQSVWKRLLRLLRRKRLETVPPLTEAQVEEACGAVEKALLEKGFEREHVGEVTSALRRSLAEHGGPDDPDRGLTRE
jgi:hypothetical protein